MVRAGALFVAVTISFVIAIIISMLMLVALHTTIENKANLLQKKVERNATSAIRLALASASLGKQEEATLIDLYGEEADSVAMRIGSWGIFEMAAVKAFSGKYQASKAVLYGNRNQKNTPAVYLVDFGEPLKVVGKTTLKGTCYIPGGKKGLQVGILDRRSYEGKELAQGPVLPSENKLPSILGNLVKSISAQLDKEASNAISGIPFYLDAQDSLVNSFIDTTRILYSKSSMTISGHHLSGNICIYSKGLVTIDATAGLRDVVVYAGSIVIKKGFKGSLQAFAKDSIMVEEGCVLEYPSVLGVFKKDYKYPQPFIRLKEGAELRGIAFTHQSEFVTDLKQTLILIEKGAIVKGQVYADGFAEIKGSVFGSVYCLKFSTSHTTNHLLDAVIDQTKLHPKFVGLTIQEEGTKRGIVKWLH